MLDSKIKNRLKEKLRNLIPEDDLSRELKVKLEEKIKNYANSLLTPEEKLFLSEHPTCVNLCRGDFSYRGKLLWTHEGDPFYKYFGKYSNDRDIYELFIEDYSFHYTLETYFLPISLDFENLDDPFIRNIYEDICEIVENRKTYLLKKRFIERVLDSRDITLTYLKKNYPEIYNLL